MSEYELHHGDCLSVLPTIAAGSIDCVCADVPSGRTNCAWDSVIPFEPMWEQLRRVTKPRGAIVLLGCTQPFTSALVMSNPKLFKYDLMWDKRLATGHGNAKTMPMRAHESICVFGGAKTTYNPQMIARSADELKRLVHTTKPTGKSGVHRDPAFIGRTSNRYDATEKYPASVIRIPAVNNGSTEKTAHPTQKPLALLEYLVKTYTNAGDTVLDFCFGSGTTGAACGNLGRDFIGIEKDAEYFALGSDRIATAYAPLRAMEAAS